MRVPGSYVNKVKFFSLVILIVATKINPTTELSQGRHRKKIKNRSGATGVGPLETKSFGMRLISGFSPENSFTKRENRFETINFAH